jgi:hypothetical protein
MSGTNVTLSFERDIKGLFRTRDVTAMKNVAGFDLHKYEDVKANADEIQKRLQDGSMPCDSAWLQSDVDKFASWKQEGMPA